AGSLDAPVDDEVRDMDVLRAELAREALREATQRELADGKGRGLGIALDARGSAGEEKRAAPALHHALERRLGDEKAAIGAHDHRLEHFGALEIEERSAHAVARVVDDEIRRVDGGEERLDLRGI